MAITTERKQGTNNSIVWCQQCNDGLGKILYDYPSAGNVSSKLESELEGLSIRHERRHPTHNPQIIYYELPRCR